MTHLRSASMSFMTVIYYVSCYYGIQLESSIILSSIYRHIYQVKSTTTQPPSAQP